MTKNPTRKAVVLPQITDTLMSRCPSRESSDEECLQEQPENMQLHKEESRDDGHLKLPVLVWPKEDMYHQRSSVNTTITLPDTDGSTVKTKPESFREELKALKEDLKQLGTYRSPPTSSFVENDGQFSRPEGSDGRTSSEIYQEELRSLRENMKQITADARDIILEVRIREEEAKKKANEEKKAARNAAKLAERTEQPSSSFSKTAKTVINSKKLFKGEKVPMVKSDSAQTNITDKEKRDSDEESVTSSSSKDDINEQVNDYGPFSRAEKVINIKLRKTNKHGNDVEKNTIIDIVNEVGRTINNRNGSYNLRPISEENSEGTLNTNKARNSAKKLKMSDNQANKDNDAGHNKAQNAIIEDNNKNDIEQEKNEHREFVQNTKSSSRVWTDNTNTARNSAKKLKTSDSPTNKDNDEGNKAQNVIIQENNKDDNKQEKNDQKEFVQNTKSSSVDVLPRNNNQKLVNQITLDKTNMNTKNGTNINDKDELSKEDEMHYRMEENMENGNNQVNGITSDDVDFYQSQRSRRQTNRDVFDNRVSDLDSVSSIAEKTIGTSRRSSDGGLPGNKPVKDKKWFLNRYRVPKAPMEIALQLHKLGFEFESNRARELHISIQTCESNLKKAIAQEKKDAIDERKRIEREGREKDRREAQRRRMEQLEAEETKRKELEAIERENRRLAAVERRKHNLELLSNINHTILQSKQSRSFRFSYFPFLPKPKRHSLTPSPELSEDSECSDSEGPEEEVKYFTPVSRVSCHSSRANMKSRK